MPSVSKTSGLTQEEVAERLGLSHERVGQIERRAFAKLRRFIYGTSDFPMLAESFGGVLDAWRAADDQVRLRNSEKNRMAGRAWRARQKAGKSL